MFFNYKKRAWKYPSSEKHILLQRFIAAFAGTNTHYIVNAVNKDLAVADIAGVKRFSRRGNDILHPVL